MFVFIYKNVYFIFKNEIFVFNLITNSSWFHIYKYLLSMKGMYFFLLVNSELLKYFKVLLNITFLVKSINLSKAWQRNLII